MSEPLPALSYHMYEETAFDRIPVLEGIVDGRVVFGITSLLEADHVKKGTVSTFSGLVQSIMASVMTVTGEVSDEVVAVIGYESAYQQVKSDYLAEYLKERRWNLTHPRDVKREVEPENRHAVPVQEPKPIPEEPPPLPKELPVVPDSPITMAELVLQIAAMQADFDIRMMVVSKRLAALEAK